MEIKKKARRVEGKGYPGKKKSETKIKTQDRWVNIFQVFVSCSVYRYAPAHDKYSEHSSFGQFLYSWICQSKTDRFG